MEEGGEKSSFQGRWRFWLVSVSCTPANPGSRISGRSDRAGQVASVMKHGAMNSVVTLPYGPCERPLDDQASLWRYVPLKTLFFYLNRMVFLPSVAKLKHGDPFEGEFFPDIVWYNTAFHQCYGQREGEVEDGFIKTSAVSPSEK